MKYERPLKKTKFTNVESSPCPAHFSNIQKEKLFPSSTTDAEPSGVEYSSLNCNRSRRSTWSRQSEFVHNGGDDAAKQSSDEIDLFSDDENSLHINCSNASTLSSTPPTFQPRIVTHDVPASSAATLLPAVAQSDNNNEEELLHCSLTPNNHSAIFLSPLSSSLKFEKFNLSINNACVEKVQTNCAICLSENPDMIGYLKTCSHTFCFDCIHQWSNVTNLCPLCKSRFSQILKWSFDVDGTIISNPSVVHVENKDAKQVDENGNDPLEHYICRVCSSGVNEHLLLICDYCDGSYHTYCINLDEVPSGTWFCPSCEEPAVARRVRYQGLHELWNSVPSDSESDIVTITIRRVRTRSTRRRTATNTRRTIATRQTSKRQQQPAAPRTRGQRNRRNATNNSSNDQPHHGIVTRSQARRQSTSEFVALSSDVSSVISDNESEHDLSDDGVSDNSSSLYSFFCKYQRARQRRRITQSTRPRRTQSNKNESFESRVRRRQISRDS